MVATGYYDLHNFLNVPGEDLPKVHHYYREPHPYFDTDVVVIGGKNSAAISALDLWRHGARVTLVHRGSRLHNHVKYWILPDIENRIKNGEIAAYFNSAVVEIGADHVLLDTPDGPVRLKNDFVFALIGYHPDYDFLRSMGIELSGDQCRPEVRPGNVGEQRARHLRGGRDCGGIADQRDFHREWTLPRPADRGGFEEEAGGKFGEVERARRASKMIRRA